MPIKQYKPITNGIRHRRIILKTNLSNDKPIKALTHGLSKKSGRNNFGRIVLFFNIY